MRRLGFLRGLAELTPSGILLALEGASVGLAAWALRSYEKLPSYALKNTLDPAERAHLLSIMAVSALVAVLIGLSAAFVSGRFESFRTERFAVRAGPTCVAAALPFLWHWRLWESEPLTFLVLVTIVAATFRELLRRALDVPAVLSGTRWAGVEHGLAGRRCGRCSRRWSLVLVLAAAAAYSTYFSWIAIQRHYRLETASMDLGLENNLLWNLVHGGPLFKSSPLGGPKATHSGYHQTYFAYVIAIPYYLFQRCETLLVVQSVILGAAAIPLYLLGRRRVGPWTGVIVALAYLLYPPLHGPNLYEFHYLPLANLFLLATFYFIEARRRVAAVLCTVLALSLREDVSALLVVLGLFLLVERRRPVAGLLLSAVAGAYFVLMKLVVMPRMMGGASTFLDTFQGLLPAGESSFTGVLKTVLGNPVFALDSVLTHDKLVYLLQIVAPVALLLWRRPVGLLLSIPGILFTILSTGYKPLIEIYFQYTSYWTAFVFLGVVVNLGWLRQQEYEERLTSAVRRSWTAAMVLATLAVSYQYGAILQRHTVRGGFGIVRFGITEEDRERHDRLYELIGMVPPDAKICSSERVVPHVSSRRDAYTLRTGLFDAEYLLLWMPASGHERPHFEAAFRGGAFGVIARRQEFVLAKRGADPRGNAAAVGIGP